MFVDKVSVSIKGGDGGNGVVSFRHEKFVDRGGPDGGDGGDGGDVIAVGSNSQNTLASYRFHQELSAKPGKPGFKQKKHGRSGKDLEIKVPVGTVISADGVILADIISHDQRVVIAKGGKGGFGNAHFVSSRRQSPQIAEKGEPGQEHDAVMELKLIAEVGLVGLPNAGKSTLLSRISNAKPEIASYPFTTIVPNLGVADINQDRSILVADIPGLIEGASEGKGLGDEFLRHVERTKVLVHVIDAYNDDLASAYQTIRKELKAYRIDLSSRPEVIALSKVDGLDQEMINDLTSQLKIALKDKQAKIYPISAKSGTGLKDLLYATAEIIDTYNEEVADIPEQIPVISLEDTGDSWSVDFRDGNFVVIGPKIERFAQRTDFENSDGVERLRDIMRKTGIMHQLERQKINPGDVIIIGDKKEHGRFEY